MLGDLSLSPLCYAYLEYAPPPIGRPPWLRDICCWYGFYPGLDLLYEPSMGDCKGLYVLTRPLPVCTHGTQHWDAMQHIYNYAFSGIVYVLYTRVVTVEGKQCWFLDVK